MELLRVVDQYGNFTGEVLERKLVHERNLLHNEIAVFVLRCENGGQILLQKRSANKQMNPNKWGLCAGHVEASESIVDAALRELEEEIGLTVSRDELHPLLERRVRIGEKNSHITYPFYVWCDQDETFFHIQEEELSQVKWHSIDSVVTRVKQGDSTLTLKEGWLPYLEELEHIIDSF